MSEISNFRLLPFDLRPLMVLMASSILLAGCQTSGPTPVAGNGKQYRNAGALHFVKLAPIGEGFEGEATLVGKRVITAVRPIDSALWAAGEDKGSEYKVHAKRFAEARGCKSWPGSGKAVPAPNKPDSFLNKGKGYWQFFFWCE